VTAPTGTELIAAERRRQIEVEGWTPEHDAQRRDEDLARAAVCYARPPIDRPLMAGLLRLPPDWPWAITEWKPTPDDRIRELAKAGALIAAEIDRLIAVGEDQP
jgi:hypothetical protein